MVSRADWDSVNRMNEILNQVFPELHIETGIGTFNAPVTYTRAFKPNSLPHISITRWNTSSITTSEAICAEDYTGFSVGSTTAGAFRWIAIGVDG